jgi:S1-C subfamily serine protease
VEWSEWADDGSSDPVPPPFDRTWRHPSELGSTAPNGPTSHGKTVSGLRASYLASGAIIVVSASLAMLVIVPFVSKMHARSDALGQPHAGSGSENAVVLSSVSSLPVASTVAIADDAQSTELPNEVTSTRATTTVQTFQRPPVATPPTSRDTQPTPVPIISPTRSVPPPSIPPQSIEGPTTTVGGIVRLVVTRADGSTHSTSGVRLDDRTIIVPLASWASGDRASSTASDGVTVEAVMVGIDRHSHLAVLDVPHDDAATKARLSSCRDVNRGGAVGVSTGDANATSGVITELATQTDSGPTSPLLRVLSSVAPGKPPIVTRDGAVLALGVSVDGRDIDAVPADLVSAAADAIRNGKAVDGRVGLSGHDFVEPGASTPSGALVTKVTSDSPAALAGIVNGDVITQIDHYGVRTWWDLLLVMRSTHATATVHITVRSAASASSPELTRTVEITLDTW